MLKNELFGEKMSNSMRAVCFGMVTSALAAGCWEALQGPAAGPNGPADVVKPYSGVRMSSSLGTVEAHQGQADAFTGWSNFNDPLTITMAGLDPESGVKSVNGYVYLTGVCEPTAVGAPNYEIDRLLIRSFNGTSSKPRKVEAVSLVLDAQAVQSMINDCSGAIIEVEGEVRVITRDWKNNVQDAVVGSFLYSM